MYVNVDAINDFQKAKHSEIPNSESNSQHVPVVHFFVAENPTAWTVGWASNKDELKATLRTKQGLHKVHTQFYHLSAKEMCRFILPLFDKSEHPEIKKSIAADCKNCKICLKFMKIAPKPGVQAKGLWANAVNDLVCADTFFVCNCAIMHFLDLFSGWSLLVTDETPNTSPELVEKAFYLWLQIFGGAPRVFFSDQGPEFMALKLEDLFRVRRVKFLRSPAQSPFTNPVERHNGIAKIYIKKLKDAHPQTSILIISQEAQVVKNLTTRKFGYSAQYLALAHPDKDARTLASGIDDLYIPGESVTDHIRERVEVHTTARRLVSELATIRRLQAALTKGMQGTVTGPLFPGQLVEFYAIPDSKSKNGHWIGPCTVIGPGGSGASNKTWVIRRPNGVLTDAHRHRLRVIEPVDQLQIPAEGPADSAEVSPPPPQAPPELRSMLEQQLDEDADARKDYDERRHVAGAVLPLGEESPHPNVQKVDTSAPAETKLFKLLGKIAFSDGVTDNWEKPSAEVISKVSHAYGSQFPTLLRVAFTRNPKRLRRLPRDLPKDRLGKRLSLAWDSKRNLTFTLWDSVDDVDAQALRAKLPTGLAEGCTLLFERPFRYDDNSSDEEPLQEAPATPPSQPVVPQNQPVLPNVPPVPLGLHPPEGLAQAGHDESVVQAAPTAPVAGSIPVMPQAAPSAASPPVGVESPGVGSTPASSADVSAGGPAVPHPASPVPGPPSMTVDTVSPAAVVASPSSPVVASPVVGSTPTQSSSGPQHYSIATPRSASVPSRRPQGSPDSATTPAASPASEASPERDNLETMVRNASRLEDGVTRSGARFRALSYNHRGPLFDQGNYVDQVSHLTSAFFSFYATPDDHQPSIPSSSWIDSPTLITNQQFADLISETEVPIFDLSRQPTLACSRQVSDVGLDTFVHVYAATTQRPHPKQPSAKRVQEISKAQAVAMPEFWPAMESEIDDLIQNGAEFGTPPSNQWVFSTRWVYTWKPPPDDRPKARLVVRGFEEKWLLDENGDIPVSDSPTLQRDTIRCIAHTAAQNGWRLEAWDIRTAFQQCDTRYDPDAPVDEHLWFRLPEPFPKKYQVSPGTALRVAANHTHNGMASAPRRFYFFLRGIFQEYGFTISMYDECHFLLIGKDFELHGMCGFHVDDGLMCGDQTFWTVMESIAQRVKFGKRLHTSFPFCGIRIKQLPDYTVEMDQEEAIDLIQFIDIEKGRNDADPLTPADVTELRSRLGSILYITGCTRPFEAYSVSHLSAYTTDGQVTHLRQVNAVIKQLKATKEFRLRFVKLDGPLVVYSFGDSNFKKERDSGSQTGSLTICGTKPDHMGRIRFNLLRWSSRRTRRVVHSTLAAETLASTYTLDINEGTRGRLRELSQHVDGVILSDCHSLWDHLYRMTSKVEEMLVPDFHQLREACIPWRHALSPNFSSDPIEFWWTPTYLMLADNLTKVTTPSRDLFRQALLQNEFCLSEFKRPRISHQSFYGLWLTLAEFFTKNYWE